jgi:uncharacterized protein DUF6220
MRLARQAHLVLSFLFVAGVVVQVFLAGMGVFDSPSSFQTHANWGYLLELIPLILLVLAGAGRLGSRQIAAAAALFGMFLLQSVFVALRADLPLVAALHPVNGFAILLVSILTAREAWLSRNAVAAQSAVTPSTLGEAGH